MRRAPPSAASGLTRAPLRVSAQYELGGRARLERLAFVARRGERDLSEQPLERGFRSVTELLLDGRRCRTGLSSRGPGRAVEDSRALAVAEPERRGGRDVE